jgi:hypothetical protein
VLLAGGGRYACFQGKAVAKRLLLRPKPENKRRMISSGEPLLFYAGKNNDKSAALPLMPQHS